MISEKRNDYKDQQSSFPKLGKSIFLVCTGIFALIILSLFIWRIVAISAPLDVTKTYIKALASGDTQTALANSSGKAALTAARLKDEKITARVDDISCKVLAYGSKGWVNVKAKVGLALKDGTAEVSWYNIEVVKTDQNWKVVSLSEATPELSGTSFFVSQTNVQKAQIVFNDYLFALTKNDWAEATKHLAGLARRQQELSTPVLSKAPVINKVANVRMYGVWEKNGLLVCRSDYEVDGRQSSSIVTLDEVKTGEWLIVNIEQEGK